LSPEAAVLEDSPRFRLGEEETSPLRGRGQAV
jgi:hypothetical protein